VVVVVVRSIGPPRIGVGVYVGWDAAPEPKVVDVTVLP
jgi:hypothetical protein